MPETPKAPMAKMSLSRSERLPTQRERVLTRVFTTEAEPTDANLGEQLAASCARLEAGLAAIGEAVSELAAKPGPRVVLTMDGPEPAWLHELRERHANAKYVGSSVCVIQRETVANMIQLIELARKKR